jgi:LAS superfamily LD-carboxypeptidase LdcB
MQQNAALYGWFHPAWAQAGGSLPEPWHWEYAG